MKLINADKLAITPIDVTDGGWCDVVHPNGIGNYGRSFKSLNGKLEPIPAYISMDCLTNSGCVRLMMRDDYECDGFIGSDFCFYKVDEE